jgi:hypothetical protein
MFVATRRASSRRVSAHHDHFLFPGHLARAGSLLLHLLLLLHDWSLVLQQFQPVFDVSYKSSQASFSSSRPEALRPSSSFGG